MFQKKIVVASIIFLFHCSLYGQNSKTITGDWMRIKVEYVDGKQVPNNHEAHLLVRYHFTEKEVYHVFPGTTYPMPYSINNNILKIGPAISYKIEANTVKAFTLLEEGEVRPIRYFLIPTDSFQVAGLIKYKREVIGTDTVYTSAPGIEPIFPKGQNEFMKSITMGFNGAKAAFTFTYVVQKDGTIGDVSISSTSNAKLNKRLVKLVQKTSGAWIPATYKGQPINVRQKATFSIGSSSRY